ncbi:MAG: tRNA threonylcarbamoyladenosine dehydratase [Eubacterium sp.]|nr:tRNA threonylcarbamoyladenosine dehydratase [Eubacterium sp.]
MADKFERTELLLGREAMEILAASRVAVFGLGGVGSYVTEALARSGIGALDLIDKDVVNISNLNRQILATFETIGMDKTEAAAKRVALINPDCRVTPHKIFLLPETADSFDFRDYDYVVDAIDTVTGKLTLIEKAKAAGTPVISCMGTGNKLDPTALRAADLFETTVCPLARIMRKECRKRGITELKCVYSEEKPIAPGTADCRETPWNVHADMAGETISDLKSCGSVPEETERRSPVPGSVSFVPSAAGLIIAGEVIRDLIRRSR